MAHKESIAAAIEAKHLSAQELAQREGVPLATVYKWNSEGTGPRYFIAGRHARYRMVDVIEWEESKLVSRSHAS